MHKQSEKGRLEDSVVKLWLREGCEVLRGFRWRSRPEIIALWWKVVVSSGSIIII